MDWTVYFFVCAFTISWSETTIAYINPGEDPYARISYVDQGPGLQQTPILPENHTELGIIGGRNTTIRKHPYQVSINQGTSFVCAGALLNRIWVIALASCTAGSAPSDLYVRLGSSSYLNGGTVYNLSEIIIHPMYNYSTMDYDYSLLRLSTYLCYNKNVSRVEFSAVPPKSGQVGTISGWGTDGNNFKELKMRTITNNICANKYTVTHDHVTGRMFCVVAGTSGPCFNDFGDPFVVNGTLYGLYSWSRGCANPNFPAVLSNLAFVKDWIYSVMDNTCVRGVY